MNQFYPPVGLTAQNVVELLERETAVSTEPPTTERLTIYDTFDWRLHTQSFALTKVGSQFTLRDFTAHHIIIQANLAETPQFVWDIPPGILRTTLAPIIAMRALMPLTEVSLQTHSYRILNQDEKTVARLILEEFCTPNLEGETPLLTLLTLQPIRGYTHEESTLADLFIENDFQPCEGEIVPKILTATGHQPGSYSPKLTIDLRPTMRADAATNVILRYMLQLMKMNEHYIKQDIDTEFLHDFRVAVRRTRSALSQVKAVFPEEETERFKEAFKYIGQLSNQLRDLDVYLLSEEDYKAQLPNFLKDDIKPLFTYLYSKRVQALQTVVDGLDSAEYKGIIQDWELFLEEPPPEDETAVNAAMPILNLAKKRIYKHYQRIIHEGNLILVDDRDDLLHELRIECKKLRYLMEFFASLFPPEEISRLVRQLKDLQTNLGDYNDFCVQEEYLLHVAREMPKSITPTGDIAVTNETVADEAITNESLTNALIAIGCLVGTLHQRRELVRSEFAGAFNQFASRENKALFTELFAPEKKQKTKNEGGKI